MSLAAAATLALALAGTSAGVPPAAGQAEATAVSAPAAEADPALLDQVLREEGISTEVPVSLEEYLGSIWRRLVTGTVGVLGRHAGWLGPASIAFLWILGGAVITALVWLAWRLVTVLLGRRRHRSPEVEITLGEAEPAAAEDLSLRYQQALEAGEYRRALALLWLRVAGGLSATGMGHLERHLTQREFIASVRSQAPRWPLLPPLADLGRRIEGAVYGPLPPTIEQVRQAEKMAGELLG